MKATRDAIGEAALELAEKHDIVVLAAGTGDSTRAYKFKEKYPYRYIEMGIAEQNMIAVSAGLSLAGKIPIATTFAAFMPGRCYDQIRQSVAYSETNVKMISTHAGITVGEDGATHQMIEDIGMMVAMPNIKVIVPADFYEAKKAIKYAVENKGGFYIRTGRPKVPFVTKEDDKFEFGKASWLRRGKDVSIIVCGELVFHALEAAKELEQEGISASVINIHTIKPLDKKAILKAAEVPIVTAEDHVVATGLGSLVANVVTENKPQKIKMVGMHGFGESGKASELVEKFGLNAKGIIKAVKEIL